MTRDRSPEPCHSDQLTRFCAGELGPEDREQVEAHLVDCEECWDEVRISRAAISAVQRLHEPAPTALRAEVRATIAFAARADRRAAVSRSHLVLLAAVAAVVLALSGLAIAAMTGPGRPAGGGRSTSSASSDVAGPVRAAVEHFGVTPASGATVPAAPDLSALGLRHSSAATVDVGGMPAVCYVYTGRAGARLEVLVGATAWVRPVGATRVGSAAWATRRGGLTVIGGPDPARDQMLVITHDRATAVSAATSLGLA